MLLQKKEIVKNGKQSIYDVLLVELSKSISTSSRIHKKSRYFGLYNNGEKIFKNETNIFVNKLVLISFVESFLEQR